MTDRTGPRDELPGLEGQATDHITAGWSDADWESWFANVVESNSRWRILVESFDLETGIPRTSEWWATDLVTGARDPDLLRVMEGLEANTINTGSPESSNAASIGSGSADVGKLLADEFSRLSTESKQAFFDGWSRVRSSEGTLFDPDYERPPPDDSIVPELTPGAGLGRNWRLWAIPLVFAGFIVGWAWLGGSGSEDEARDALQTEPPLTTQGPGEESVSEDPETSPPQTETASFGSALQSLVDSDPAAFGPLQNFASILSVFDFAWSGSAQSAFELFNIRRTGTSATHPDGETTGTQAGATDIVKVIAFFLSMSQQQVAEAFNQSDFPCGEGEVATTFCPDGAPEVPAGEVVMVGATLVAPVPLESTDRSYLYFVGFEDGDPANNLTDGAGYRLGTDRRYLLSYSPGGGWVVEVEGIEESAARFIVLDDAVLLVVPLAELGASPTFRFATFENAGDGLDLTNTSDWAGDAVPSVGAQLLPVVPLEPPTVTEVASAEDPPGDTACEGVLDVTSIRHLVRGRQARFMLGMADDVSLLVEDGFGLDITLKHPGGLRTWSVAIAPNRTTLSPDDPSLGEN
ncbi:MAG TPA: hypothetical protein VMM81_07870, partial [Acidimicrobiia bacterium]|nr:hypothetical protein [Acidimicrobiia bacterium]